MTLHPGKRLGRLVLQRFVSREGWIVICDCGTEKLVRTCNLKEKTRSCGCLRRENTGDMFRKHGKCHSAEYGSYMAMIARCENPNNEKFSRYGQRGIKICESWRRSFDEFLADMGSQPQNCPTVERIDPDEDYTPDNRLWVPREDNKPDTRLGRLTIHGRLKKQDDSSLRIRQREQRRTNGSRLADGTSTTLLVLDRRATQNLSEEVSCLTQALES